MWTANEQVGAAHRSCCDAPLLRLALLARTFAPLPRSHLLLLLPRPRPHTQLCLEVADAHPEEGSYVLLGKVVVGERNGRQIFTTGSALINEPDRNVLNGEDIPFPGAPGVPGFDLDHMGPAPAHAAGGDGPFSAIPGMGGGADHLFGQGGYQLPAYNTQTASIAPAPAAGLIPDETMVGGDARRSAKTCSQLAWPVKPSSSYEGVCGQTQSLCTGGDAMGCENVQVDPAPAAPNLHCSGKRSYAAAKAMCEAKGARLCSAAEIGFGNNVHGTGCG